MSHNAFARRWNDARDEVRPGTNFHALRHLGLTLYAQAGATTTETMRRGGHKDVEAAPAVPAFECEARSRTHGPAERHDEGELKMNDGANLEHDPSPEEIELG